ncbi:MAG: VOC family protein [Candidatus Entotheonellia bacterium]
MTVATLLAQDLSVTLTANDLERSIQFYSEGLGFLVAERMETDGKVSGVMLEAGRAMLALSQDDFAKGRNRVKGVGMGLYLVTDQDIEGLAQKAKAAGISLESEPAPLPWGPMGFTVKDPDGFKLTIANPE